MRTEYGYHLIQVTDITPEAQLPYDEVKEKIRSSLLAQRQTETWDAWLQSMEDKLGVMYESGFAPARKARTTTTSSDLTTSTTEG